MAIRKTPEPADDKATTLGGDVSNSGADTITAGVPYYATVAIRGSAALLFHRWQSDSVEAKAKAAKGSAAKKTDDVESYVWRDDANQICLPGEYLRGSISGPQGAAKYRQDPRSPRKSALDLYKAGVIVLTELAPLSTVADDVAKVWDYLDRRRVTVQRNGITRERPAFLAGWSASFDLAVLLPAYIDSQSLFDVIADAGRFVGLADNRPTYGRFSITGFAVRETV
jgi:hypothetical protein